MERECQDFSKDFLESLRRLKCDETLTDFVLKVGGEDIPVHRTVLGAASPYFEAMLSNDTIEKKRGWAEILDLDPDAVKACIDFIYSGKAKLSPVNPEHLIQASDLMQLSLLKTMYFEFLIENVTIETCHCYLDLASKYHAEAFVAKLRDYVLKNIDKILDSDYISKRSEAELGEALDLLPANLPNREIRKWKAIETWMKADAENRGEKFPDVFKLLLLDKIPLECLARNILVSDFVRNSDECKDAIIVSLADVKNRPEVQVDVPLTTNNAPPPYTGKPTHLAALNMTSSLLHVMNLTTYQWSRLGRIPLTLRIHSMVSLRNKLYLRTFDGKLVCFSSGEWEELCALDKELKSCPWLGSNDIIWFIQSDCIRKYNPFTNCWTALFANFPHSVQGCKFAISRSHILAVCSSHNSAVEFDFNKASWGIISGPILSNPVLCAIREDFFVFGGALPMCYKPGIDDWIDAKFGIWVNSLGTIRLAVSCSGLVCIIGSEGRLAVYRDTPNYDYITDVCISDNFSSFCFI